MQVLHITPAYWPFWGGAEAYAQQISERLARNGHLVSVVTSDAKTVDNFWYPNCPTVSPLVESHRGVQICRSPVRHLPAPPFGSWGLRRAMLALSDLPATAGLLQALARLTPYMPGLEPLVAKNAQGAALIHGMNISLEFPLICGLQCARRLGVPFVATPFVHVGRPGHCYVSRNYTMRHQVRALQSADRVIVQTDIERRALAGLGVREEKLVRVGVGVDPAALQGGDGARFRALHNIDGPLVAFVGSVTRDKGAIHLVEAMRHLWARGPQAWLAMAGVQVAEFQRYFERLSPGDARRVLLLGQVPEQDKLDLLAAAQVLALPSRVDSFGIVYLEAWMCGLPVIGARAGGVPDVITDGQDGLLVEYGDVAALASAIATLLDNPDLARALAERGKAKVLARYTWDRLYAQVLNIYEELVGQT